MDIQLPTSNRCTSKVVIRAALQGCKADAGPPICLFFQGFAAGVVTPKPSGPLSTRERSLCPLPRHLNEPLFTVIDTQQQTGDFHQVRHATVAKAATNATFYIGTVATRPQFRFPASRSPIALCLSLIVKVIALWLLPRSCAPWSAS
jgi:hypothetical protein